MQLWTLPGENPEGTLLYTQTLDSNYFIRADMRIEKIISEVGTVNLNLQAGGGLFAVNVGDIPGHAEVLMEIRCDPKISFFGDAVVFNGEEAALFMDVYWKVRTSLFLHSQLRPRHCSWMCPGRCVLF